MKLKSNNDLDQERVKSTLDFQPEELEQRDDKGYTALTKACSLPAVGISVVSHLINTKMVDVNSQLPPELNTEDAAAKWLTPGMTALSVAIRRGNVKCISTFMNRKQMIDFESKDHDGNTALHYCLLSSNVSKDAFKKPFPCYQQLNIRGMRNGEDKSPLDIAVERWKQSDTKKEEKNRDVLEFVLNNMDPSGKLKNQ